MVAAARGRESALRSRAKRHRIWKDPEEESRPEVNPAATRGGADGGSPRGGGAGVEASPTDGGTPRLELDGCLEAEKPGGGALVDDMLGEDEKKTGDDGEGRIRRCNRAGEEDGLRTTVASRR